MQYTGTLSTFITIGPNIDARLATDILFWSSNSAILTHRRHTINTLFNMKTVWLAKHTHTHPFNGPFSGTTQVSRYQKGKTNLDFTEPRDSEWQWHQLDHMQVCTLLQTDNHANIPPLSFLQAGCPSCRPTNSVKALAGNSKAKSPDTRAVFSVKHTYCYLIIHHLQL